MNGRKNLHSCGWSIATTRMPLTRFWPLTFDCHSTTSSTITWFQTYQIAITYLVHLILECIDWKDTFHSYNTQQIDAFNHAWTTSTSNQSYWNLLKQHKWKTYILLLLKKSSTFLEFMLCTDVGVVFSHNSYKPLKKINIHHW